MSQTPPDALFIIGGHEDRDPCAERPILRAIAACAAGIGPRSIASTNAARWVAFSSDGCPGALRSIRCLAINPVPCDQSGALRSIRCLAINQAVRTCCIKLHHPVADDLQRNPADPRHLRSARPLIDRS